MSNQRNITEHKIDHWEIDQCEKTIKNTNAGYLTKKNRESHKTKLQKLYSQNPEATKSLKFRLTPGRPRLEEQQSDLLKTIVNIPV